jgi:anti-sigma-K factor RskA
MYDDDRDALAAEYVLGTLAADEREQAEALLVIDPGFAEIVRVWERRLGELNVMVEAVDPPPDLWDKIRGEIDSQPHDGQSHDITAAEIAVPPFEHTSPEIAPEPHPETEPAPDPLFETASDIMAEVPQDLDELNPPRDLDELNPPRDLDELNPPQDLEEPKSDLNDASLVDALASSLLEPEGEPEEAEVAAESLLPPEPPLAMSPLSVERSAEIIKLRRRVRHSRGVAALMTAIAAVLALFVAVTQFAPGLVPLSRQPQPIVAAQPPQQPPSARLTAVLKQEPTAPAFLLTVDPQNKSFTVRTVSATPESGRSYQLWLISNKDAGPRSLGLVGGEEFTTRPLPSGFDIATLRTADYAVSLEPAGGSPTGAPTGPILFTGKMFESVPGSPS